ncbi:TPA: hypothetical protein N0F65_002930 [Lagenidium giganteum]|uniref:DUF4219 domain-containing protein n=1 Tax=Lagenidium giganteum TaxID=4803 RepID=A0AAV2Z8W6_9STRA|nr:TPA: hypothetical protein N0F65_002930 [Lagenidium giganteum]
MKWNREHNFTGSNFVAWKMRVQIFLEAEDLWNIVTFREVPNDHPRGDREAFDLLERRANSILLNSVDDSMLVALLNRKYACEVYDYLCQTYQSKTWGMVVALREQFANIRYEDGTNLQEHLNKL